LKNNSVTTTTQIARYFDGVAAMPLLKSVMNEPPKTDATSTEPTAPTETAPDATGTETEEMKKMKETIEEIKKNQATIVADQAKLKEYIVANA
jgi:hypothetical protein